MEGRVINVVDVDGEIVLLWRSGGGGTDGKDDSCISGWGKGNDYRLNRGCPVSWDRWTEMKG